MDNENKTIVRLKTNSYIVGSKAVLKKEISTLKRKSVGYNLIEEYEGEDLMSEIINLNQCEDGIYLLTTCNHQTDWETGYLDDWGYILTDAKERDN